MGKKMMPGNYGSFIGGSRMGSSPDKRNKYIGSSIKLMVEIDRSKCKANPSYFNIIIGHKIFVKTNYGCREFIQYG